MSTRLVAAAFCSALLLLASAPAGAVSISGVGVANGSSANSFDDGDNASETVSGVALQSSQASGFTTRYTAVVAADKQGSDVNPGFAEATLTGSYTITFTVDAAVGETWRLQIDTLWLASMTAVDDIPAFNDPRAIVDPLGVTGSILGIGLASGSLAAADPGRLFTGSTAQVEINQSGSATTLLGSGTTNLTLTFGIDAVVQSACFCSSPFGRPAQEAALRMGIASTLSNVSAGDYPGQGSRDINDDGHFVTVSLVAEPGSALLALSGLLGLALAGRQRMR